MSTGPKWGVTPPRFRLALCAVGVHKFYYMCANKDAGRDTLRVCYDCERTQERTELSIGQKHAMVTLDYTPWRFVR